MRSIKKLVSYALALALAFSVLAIPSVSAQAAATKTTTYTYDAKSGICYQTAFRSSVLDTWSDNQTEILLQNAGDYISSVKSSSSNLICKKVYKYAVKSEYSSISGTGSEELNLGEQDIRFKTRYNIQVFAKNQVSIR